MITARIEDYLEELFLLESTGRTVTVTDLAERLKITSGEILGSLIWFMCFLFLLFPIASPKLIEPALLFTELVVGSAVDRKSVV